MTRNRIVALLAALAVAFTGTVALAPAANAAPAVVWYVHFGSAVTPGNSPNVWSNRVPTWQVGLNPIMTAQTDGDLTDRASFCGNGGLCWHSNTANAGPGPWQTYWDSRPGTTGSMRVYSHDGVIRFSTNTDKTTNALMILWDNGCLDMYSYAGGYWGNPIWQNSYSSACAIYY